MTFRFRKPFLEFPLLKRELIGLLRTRKAFWLLLSVVSFSSLLPILYWPTVETSMVLSFQVLWLFGAFFTSQLVLALLVIPAFTAGAISGERERETYELLYSSQLSPFSIIFSKTLASTGYVLILLLASAPSVCVLHLLGGVSFGTILKCYAVIFAAAVASGLICLKQSMRSKRTAHAAVRGVMLVAFWNGGLLIILIIALRVCEVAFRAGFNPGILGSELTTGLSPFSAIVVAILGHEMSRLGMPGTSMEPWLLNVMFSGVVSAWQLFYLLRKVRTPELSSSRWRERWLLARPGKASRPPKRAWLARALIAMGEEGSTLLGNPVFLKEVRSEFFSRVWFRIFLFVLPLVLFSTLYYLNESDLAVVLVSTVALILILILCPAIAASAIPREFEQGNLDFLRGTLLSLRSVLWGKFLASLYSTWGLVAAALWAILLFTPHSGPNKWICASVIVVTFVFVNSLATFASVLSRKTLGALVVSYIAVLLIFLGWPLLERLIFGRENDFMVATSPFILIWQRWSGVYAYEFLFLPGRFVGFVAMYGMAAAGLVFLSMERLQLRARDR